MGSIWLEQVLLIPHTGSLSLPEVATLLQSWQM